MGHVRNMHQRNKEILLMMMMEKKCRILGGWIGILYRWDTEQSSVASVPSDDVSDMGMSTAIDERGHHCDNVDFGVDTEGMLEEVFRDHVDSKSYGPMYVRETLRFRNRNTWLACLNMQGHITLLKVTTNRTGIILQGAISFV
jgi:hypothetical protein